MYAIFEQFNKQYLVRKNQIIVLDKINILLNSIIEFNKILFLYENNISYIGFPYLLNRKITAIVIDHFKNKKINILKFKRRKHYLRKYNHRQLLTKIKIINII